MDNDGYQIAWILDSIGYLKKGIAIVYFKIPVLLIGWRLQTLQLFKDMKYFRCQLKFCEGLHGFNELF